MEHNASKTRWWSRSRGWLLVLLAAACASRDPGAFDPAAPLVLHDISVVDVVSGVLHQHQSVVVSGARIVSVDHATAFVPPPGSKLIDGRGRYLIPGLWDMHSHSLWSAEAMNTFLALAVANGVVGIRDMGGRLDVLAAFRETSGRDERPWPRVVAAGAIIDGAEPVQAEISIAVADPEQARAAVELLAEHGVDFIKVYTLISRDAYFALTAAAREHNLPIAGHVPAAVTPAEAARSGQRSFEHLRDELEPLCSPTDEAGCLELVNLLREHRVWQVPTLGVLRYKATFDNATLEADPRLAYLPVTLRAEWLTELAAKRRRGNEYLAGKRRRYTEELWLTELLIRAGVPLLAGTDAGVGFSYPGFSLHDELELLVKAGMSPLDALRAATLGPAQFLGETPVMGSVEAGKIADLVVLRENPLVDITAIREIELVVLRGRWLSRMDLDALLSEVLAANQD